MKKQSILIIILIVIILAFSVFITLMLLKENVLDTQIKDVPDQIKPLVSKPTSSPENPEDTPASFSLKQTTVATPVNGLTLDFNFTYFSPKEIKVRTEENRPDSFKVISDKFNLILFVVPESFGGLYPNQPEVSMIANKLGSEISRVSESESINVIEFLSKNNLKNNYGYFYSDSFKIGAACGSVEFENMSCGGASIKIKGPKPGYGGNLKIYCGVDVIENVKYCDDFVKHLELINSIESSN